MVTPTPPGWMTMPAPEEGSEPVEAALRSAQVWAVHVEGYSLRIAPAEGRVEADVDSLGIPDRVREMRFEGEPRRGERRFLAVDGGYLVGVDAGEWGGGLYWCSSDGLRRRQVGEHNVLGLERLSEGQAVAFEGCAHLGLDTGGVRRIGLPIDDARPRLATRDELGGCPRFVAGDADPFVVFAGPDGRMLYRVAADGTSFVQTLVAPLVYPHAWAADPFGTIYVGMRGAVLRLSRDGDGFREEWLVRAR